MKRKKAGIVGFGRFGKVLARLLGDDFAITVFDRSEIHPGQELAKKIKIAKNTSEIYENEVIFYCVPIRSFEEVIKTHKKYFRDHHLLIDVLSVKLHPGRILNKYLSGLKTQALLTHPMFGPDSSRQGFTGLPIVLDKFTSNKKNYNFWRKFFTKKGLHVIEMSADEHDRLAANSQGVTHFLGRLLERFKFRKTPIDTVGAQKLHEVMEQTCNDTWELFLGLQNYNPYTKSMRIKLGKAYDKLHNRLLPKRVNPNLITIGIQGGRGSFNEEAINDYLKRTKISKHKIKYLYTTEKVLNALHKGEIDLGQFAIQNSVGGVVQESVEAMAKYKFDIVKQFAIKISHTLMIGKDAGFSEVDTIVTHPQVLAQCKKTLSKKYPHLKQTSGRARFIDHALVAKKMSEGKLPKNKATMGSKVLAEIYGLKIVEDNLQDAKENYTSFLIVKNSGM